MIAVNDVSATIRKIKEVDNVAIKTSGSKHVFVYSFLFALLCSKNVVLNNVPNISDTDFLIEYAVKAGANVTYDKENQSITITKGIERNTIWTPFVVNCRSSLIAVTLHAIIFSKSYLVNSIGGCKIGERKIDQHIRLWKALGGEVSIGDTISVEIFERKCCEDFVFDIDTTMGTVCALFALSQRRLLKVTNPSQRPEIIYLVEFMNKLGYPIRYQDQSFVMDGNVQNKQYVEYKMPDDIDECLGWACFCHANSISARIIADVPYIESVKFLERVSHGEIKWEPNALTVSKRVQRPKKEKCEIIASEFPHIGSDQQPVFSVWASLLSEEVIIEDRKFPNRFAHLDQLKTLGWKTRVVGNIARIVFESKPLDVVRFIASDLRASFAFLLAGTVISKGFELLHYEQLMRGYADINKKLEELGYEIVVKEESSHCSVAIIVTNTEGKLLLQKRDILARKNPGKVSFFGGAIEKNETPYEAAQRELREELGISCLLEYVGSYTLNQNAYSMSGTVFLFALVVNGKGIKCYEGELIERTYSDALKENLTTFARTVIESRVIV